MRILSVIHHHQWTTRILLYMLVVLSMLVVGTAWGQPGTNQEVGNWTFPVALNAPPFSSIQPRPKLPIEPDEFDPREINAYYDWRNDMFFREFDLTGSGSVNFMTARRTYKVWLDEYGTPVVLTMGDPVFYWIDLNGNGKFEQELGEMFKDSYEDGVTGNEEPYDNSDLQEPAGPGPQWGTPQH
ncbi:MAG: hypothetical protein OEY80_13815 [Nitrospirota bacterium]|nr:hypothetical protein [Nitrospirota bacterium]